MSRFESIETRALDLGVAFWDTANVHGGSGAGGFGSNETLLSQLLAAPSAGTRC